MAHNLVCCFWECPLECDFSSHSFIIFERWYVGMNYYRCYSQVMMNFFANREIRYIITAKDIKTGSQFWLYAEDEKFESAYSEWVKNNPRRKG